MVRKSSLVVDDRVQYSAEFLRSIGAYTGEVPQMKGKITGIRSVGSLTIAAIVWDGESEPKSVNVINLSKCR